MNLTRTRPAQPGETLPPRGRAAERVLAAEMLDELRTLAQTMTSFAERLQGRIWNNVLQVETCVVDSAGTPVSRNWGAPAGCVVVENYSDTNTLTVESAGPAGAAPTSGVGVERVPPGSRKVIALNSTTVTFYGTAGDAFSFQAFTAAPIPAVT
jgi:hypothetical protein